MQVGYIQFAPEFGETARNLEALERIAREHAKGADLLVLPELAGTGYLFTSREETLRFAEPFPDGPTAQCFARVARETGAVVVGGFAERDGDRAFNSAALVRPDGTGHIYRKAQLFKDEKSFFEPGDTPFEPVEAGGVKLGLMVCFDWYYPEVARLLALRGAHILCHPSNLVLPYCPESMKTRCLENRVFAVTCNRTGSDRRGDRELHFIGMSQITGPDGSIILRAPRDGVHVGIAEIDPSLAENKDITGNNVWTEDRRRDLFGGLTE
ncbi:MAG: acyltransferase [Candidatus Eisenbacteria bacterium]|nr:acyltransferase [Candidatus Eisenbacteria bacterium]